MWVEYFPPNGDDVLTFAYEPPYIIEAFDGLGDNRAAPITTRGPAQRGTTLRDVSVSERVVPLTIMVMIDGGTVAQLEAAKAALRRALVVEPGGFGSPPALGLLRFHRDDDSLDVLELEALPRESPQFTRTNRVNWAEADIEFVAPYPYPRETMDRVFNVAGEGGFEFPVEFVAGGWEMPSFNVEVDIDNGGDVRAPIMAAIWGDVTDPVLYNDTTGEQIRYVGNIPAGERLEINTDYGQISAELVDADEVRANAMGDIDHSVTSFWSLRPGVNTVRFGASINNGGFANVYWRQRFVGS
jgi:hypothetical protein